MDIVMQLEIRVPENHPVNKATLPQRSILDQVSRCIELLGYSVPQSSAQIKE